MNEFDFDAKLREMITAEQVKYQADIEKRAYTRIPIDTIRLALLDDFYDYLITVSSIDTEMSIESIINPSRTKSPNTIAAEVYELLQTDIDRYADKLFGKVELRGDFPYFVEPDVDEYQAHDQVLWEGESLRGEAVDYKVERVVPYSSFIRYQNETDAPYDENEGKVPKDFAIIMIMENAQVIGEDGTTKATYERLYLPYSYPNIEVYKLKLNIAYEDGESLDIMSHLNGGIFIEFSNDIENDLNYNEYSEKEFSEKRHEAQMQLEEFMAVIDKEAPLQISADTATTLQGEKMPLRDVLAFYDQTSVIKDGSTWRVAHGFALINIDGEGHNSVVHVLPEDLRSIKRQ